MKPIAICQNTKIFDHYTSWIPRYVEYCNNFRIPYEIIDCYKYDVIRKLSNYSALVWNYGNYVISDLLEARNIIAAAEGKGLITFPNTSTGWHFDDKIAEMYALQSVDAPIPKSWVFYLLDECIEWLEREAEYPLVAKLRCGSGSNNVKLLKNKSQAIKYSKRMFLYGYQPAPSFAYKAYSKLQSAKNLATIIDRVKKIPQFLNTRRHAKMMPIEKGYCYFQSYIKNSGYDLKIVVVNKKLTFCARNVRKNDFRASGGGSIYYDKSLLTPQIIDTAFKIAELLKLQCIGFDFVVDSDTGEGKIIEMCYGFDYKAQEQLECYVDRNHEWHNEPLVVPDEIIDLIYLGVLEKDTSIGDLCE